MSMPEEWYRVHIRSKNAMCLRGNTGAPYSRSPVPKPRAEEVKARSLHVAFQAEAIASTPDQRG